MQENVKKNHGPIVKVNDKNITDSDIDDASDNNNGKLRLENYKKDL